MMSPLKQFNKFPDGADYEKQLYYQIKGGV